MQKQVCLKQDPHSEKILNENKRWVPRKDRFPRNASNSSSREKQPSPEETAEEEPAPDHHRLGQGSRAQLPSDAGEHLLRKRAELGADGGAAPWKHVHGARCQGYDASQYATIHLEFFIKGHYGRDHD